MLNKITTLLLLISGLTCSSALAQNNMQHITGTVFQDDNQNGAYDRNEKGIEGIMVSNQREVVLTDEKGSYNIDINPGQALMVIKPSGYEVPMNEFNIPQFSHIYEPNGSPNSLKYRGLDPTGAFPDTLNFPLIPSKNTGKPYNALIFGDPQPRDNKELDYVRDTFIDQAAGEDASFMMILGDIMYNDLSLFDRHKKLFSKTDIPVWHVIGNHDINFDTDGNRHARDTFKRQLGANYYAFQYGKVTFIALDNIDYMGRGENGRSKYRGNVWGDQLTWLENLLSHIPEDHLIVIGTHIPLYAWGGETENVNTLNREELFKVLEKREKILALSGHLHMTYHYFLGEEAGWTGKIPIHQLTATTVSGTWWGGPKDENNIPVTTQRDGVPNGYHRFTFNGPEYREQLVGLEESENMQMRVEIPVGDISSEKIPEELVVNVFNGNEKSKVWYRINNQEWTEMKQVTRSSPYYQYLLDEFPADWSSSLSAIPTNHLWSSPLNLEIGPNTNTYHIEIKTTDAYGKEWRSTKVVEVEN